MAKVKLYTNDVEQFYDFEEIYVENKGKSKIYKIEEAKYHKNMLLIKFEGIETPEQVDLLRGSILLKQRAELKTLEEGQFYIVDLIGLDVVTDENETLGTLEDVYNTGANDIYVVKSKEGKQILLPGIPDVILQTDLENRKITVHLIEGLI